MKLFICLSLIFIFSSLHAGEISFNALPEVKTPQFTGAPSIRKTPVSVPISSTAKANESCTPRIALPGVELGFFCIFELKLEKKLKLPVNFQLQ